MTLYTCCQTLLLTEDVFSCKATVSHIQNDTVLQSVQRRGPLVYGLLSGVASRSGRKDSLRNDSERKLSQVPSGEGKWRSQLGTSTAFVHCVDSQQTAVARPNDTAIGCCFETLTATERNELFSGDRHH